ncbi:MAG: type II toxin-antitoxin system RelE/ParE family toxin [Candidatus Sumerlaeota bacterium]|nr:type II toxin-antitoxin system RelE/ParE family toxin [Candidatus Sumerlaeota bacterium]
MAGYRVFIKPSAAKELDAVGSKKDRQRIVQHILRLAEDPRPPGCRKISGAEKYRIRCGVYRVLYSIEAEALVVYVVKVGHRRDVYR